MFNLNYHSGRKYHKSMPISLLLCSSLVSYYSQIYTKIIPRGLLPSLVFVTIYISKTETNIQQAGATLSHSGGMSLKLSANFVYILQNNGKHVYSARPQWPMRSNYTNDYHSQLSSIIWRFLHSHNTCFQAVDLSGDQHKLHCWHFSLTSTSA